MPNIAIIRRQNESGCLLEVLEYHDEEYTVTAREVIMTADELDKKTASEELVCIGPPRQEPTEQVLRQVATAVRRYIDVRYDGDTAGTCIEASELIKSVATRLGIPGMSVIEGWCRWDDDCYGSDRPYDPHTWAECRLPDSPVPYYVDVTADQFNYGMAPENEFPEVIVTRDRPSAMRYEEPDED